MDTHAGFCCSSSISHRASCPANLQRAAREKTLWAVRSYCNTWHQSAFSMSIDTTWPTIAVRAFTCPVYPVSPSLLPLSMASDCRLLRALEPMGISSDVSQFYCSALGILPALCFIVGHIVKHSINLINCCHTQAKFRAGALFLSVCRKWAFVGIFFFCFRFAFFRWIVLAKQPKSQAKAARSVP